MLPGLSTGENCNMENTLPCCSCYDDKCTRVHAYVLSEVQNKGTYVDIGLLI